MPEPREPLYLVLPDRPVPDRPKAHPVRFHAWNTLGRAAMAAGSALCNRGAGPVGLMLCGWAGWLDAVADGHR